MEKALAIQKKVQEILGTEEVYLVGGSVRDLVMGNEPKDYDFTTPMLPDDIEAKVIAAGRHAYTIGKAFGTIGFKCPYFREDNTPDSKTGLLSFEYVEITTFRSEVYSSKSRKPEVQFVPSLDEDLARRDFTMNAMVLKSDGKIYDPYGGRLDIHAKQIKTVGKPKDRIQEDPLRMLRAARFAARYDFKIDPNFIGKSRQLADRIFDVSIERWVQELDKILVSTYSENGILELIKMDILRRIIPEVNMLLNDYPNFEGIVLLNKNIKTADEGWQQLLAFNGSMFFDDFKNKEGINKLNKYINSGICHRLKFSNERTKIVLGQVSKETMDK